MPSRKHLSISHRRVGRLVPGVTVMISCAMPLCAQKYVVCASRGESRRDHSATAPPRTHTRDCRLSGRLMSSVRLCGLAPTNLYIICIVSRYAVPVPHRDRGGWWGVTRREFGSSKCRSSNNEPPECRVMDLSRLLRSSFHSTFKVNFRSTGDGS